MRNKTSPILERRAESPEFPARKYGPRPRRPSSRVVLNVRLLVISVVVLALLIPSAIFWHGFQTRRNRDNFLANAVAAEEKAVATRDEEASRKHWKEATKQLLHYIQLDPSVEENLEAKVRLAIATDEGAETGAEFYRASQRYLDVIGLVEDPQELKKLENRLGILLVTRPYGIEALTDAIYRFNHLRELKKSQRESFPTGWMVLQIAEYRKARFEGNEPSEEVLDALAEIEDYPIQNIDLANLYAAICYELENQNRGSLWGTHSDKALDQMVEANPEDYRAYLSRFNNRYSREVLKAGEIPNPLSELAKQLEHDLDQAKALAPDQPEVLLAAGQFAFATRQYDEARENFDRLVRVSPDDLQGYLVLGLARLQSNQPDEAIKVWKQGFELRGFDDDVLAWSQHVELADRLYRMHLPAKRLDEGSDILDELVQDYEKAKYSLSEAQQIEFQAFVDMRRAGIAVERGEHRKAIPLLERALQTQRQPDNREQLKERLWTLETLGESYTKIRQHDQAARYFNRVRELYPLFDKFQDRGPSDNPQEAAGQLPLQYAVASADSLLNSERHGAAIRAYQRIERDLNQQLNAPKQDLSAAQATALKRMLADVLTKTALAEYRRQVQRPSTEREWEKVQESVDKALETRPDSLQAGLLALQLNLTRRDKVRATQALQELESRHPNSPQVWRVSMVASEVWGEPGEADRKLEEFVRRAPNSNAAVEFRAWLLSRRRQWDEAKELLEREYQAETAKDRARLEVKLANIELSTGSYELARRRYERLLAESFESFESEQKIALLRSLIQMSLADPNRDSETLQGYIDQLKAIEGAENGTWWRLFEATHWISERANVSPQTLKKVEAHRKEIENRRPYWQALHVLKAQIAVHREEFEEAIRHCETAIRLGDHSFTTYRMLIQLLGKQQRFDELDHYLARMGDAVLFEQGLTTMAISRFADTAVDASGDIDKGRLDQSIYFARQNVKLRPEDHMARLWLSQILLMAGEKKEAEAVLREAVDSWPGQPVTWIGLIAFYFNENQTEVALAELGRLAETEVPDDQKVEKHFTLARGYEQAEKAERATHHYSQALERDPNNERILARAANYLLKTDPMAADPLLRRLIVVSKNQKRSHQQNLAMLLGTHGGDREWREAVRIVDSLLYDAQGAEIPRNRRIKAMILAGRNTSENRQQAIDLLKQVVAHPSATAADRLKLAALYEQEGQNGEAHNLIKRLTARDDLTREQLAAVVDFYLRNNEQLSAKKALEALAVQAPDEIVTLQMEARLLEKRGENSRVPSLVTEFVDRRLGQLGQADRQVELLLGAASVCALLDLNEAAEEYYRRALEIDPASSQHYAIWLARQNRHEQALDLTIKRHETEQSSESLRAILALLTVESPTEQSFQRAQPYLAEAEAKYQDDVAMLTVVAAVFYKEQRFEESLKSYLRVIELDPDNLVALNNAAWMLAERGQDSERALELIQHAIDRYGPNLQLRDTRGMIYFFREDMLAAVIDLKAVVREPDADAQHHFHYALALQKSGKIDEARESLETARNNGLSRQSLTSVEQELLDNLEKELGN